MSKKILVVDDEETIRKFLRIHLAKSGYEVKEAVDGVQAIDLLRKEHFDLIICDIMMPRRNGWEVIEEVKTHSSTKNTPVIVLTAKNQDEDMFKGYEMGASYYITKPFTKSQLFFAVNLIFDNNKKINIVK
jgi:DNA-binding response OmpR family regulator